MNSQIYSIKSGRKKFSNMIRVLALYNEKRDKISNFLHDSLNEIENTETLINQKLDDLTKSFLARNSRKEKKLAYIQRLKSEKDQEEARAQDFKKRLSELKIKTFGSMDIPKICFGEYIKNTLKEKEALEWEIIRLKDNRALLLSVNIIEQMPYSEDLVDTVWRDSCIRRFLNGKFLDEVFSSEERSMIIETEVANPGNISYKTASSSNTRDNVFIPSANEVRRFFKYDSQRRAYATEYALSKGVYADERTNGSYWWLRTNGGNLYNAVVVNFTGYVFDYGFYVNREEIGIRPALWIDIG